MGMAFWNSAPEFRSLVEHYTGMDMPMMESGMVLPANLSRRMQINQDPDVRSRHIPWHKREYEIGGPPIEYYFYLAGIAVLVGYVLTFIFAAVYHHGIVSHRPQWQSCDAERGFETEDFRTAPLGCLENMDYCLYGYFCRICRYADTVSSVGLYGYWPFVIGFVIQDCIFNIVFAALSLSTGVGGLYNPSTYFVLAYTIALDAFFIANRKKLRQIIGLSPTCMRCDCRMWVYFSCCAVIQEAREIDEATGTRAACCFKLIALDSASTMPLVGAAVSARTVQLTASTAN